MFAVYKDGNLVFTGTNFECYKYILDHQPQSVSWAERYGGWLLCKKKEKE